MKMITYGEMKAIEKRKKQLEIAFAILQAGAIVMMVTFLIYLDRVLMALQQK
jgi:hypothetical protein